MAEEPGGVDPGVGRYEVAEVAVFGVEVVPGPERITPRGPDVAVGGAHHVREADAQREFVEPFSVAERLQVGDASLCVVTDRIHVGHHSVRILPARRERELSDMTPPVEIEGQCGAGRRRPIFGMSRGRLALGLAVGTPLGDAIGHAVAAVGGPGLQSYAQAAVPDRTFQHMAVGPAPAPRCEGFGARQQILGENGGAPHEPGVELFDGLERVERYGGPAVRPEQVQSLAVAACRIFAVQGGRVGGGIAYRVEIDHVPAAAGRIDQIDGQLRRGDRNRFDVFLTGDAVALSVVGGRPDGSAVGGSRGEAAVGRSRKTVFAPFAEVEAVGFIAARGDRAVVELAVGGPQVAQRDVGASGDSLQALAGFDPADPHARIVGDERVEPFGRIVPGQSVHFGEARHGPGGALPQ